MNTRRAAGTPAKDDEEIGAHGRLITLEEGVYALSFPTVARADAAGAVKFPAIQVSSPPADDYERVEIVTGTGDPPEWCDAAGGVVVVKAPAGGGVVLVTTFGATSVTEATDVDVRWLGSGMGTRVPPPAALAASHLPDRVPEPLRSEIVLHIEREGDRRFDAPGWAGTRGQRRRLEAFSVRPLDTLNPGDVEYKAFGRKGWETPWMSDAQLCGTRGRGLPLTGFAVRLVPHLRDRFDVIYEGAFFDGDVTRTMENGEPCASTIKDDPLEAINVRILPRRA